MKGKNKKIITAIILILIMISIVLTISIITLKGKEDIKDESTKENYEKEIQDNGESKIENANIISSYEYMIVYNCIQEYINVIDFTNFGYFGLDDEGGYSFIASEEEISKEAYDLLSKQYIKENNIKDTEVFKYIDKIEISNLLTIIDIRKLYENNQVESFGVHFVLQNTTDYETINEGYVIVNIDNNNLTYSIEPVKVNNIEEIKLNGEVEEIESNINNEFKNIELSDADIIRACINRYKRICFISPEVVYKNILDGEYREARFGNIEKFKEYINNNKELLQAIDIKKYQLTQSNSQNQYVCIDQNGKYYILRVKSILDCSLILDTYSIDIPEFIEKYDSASETNKVGLNANKIVEAANNQDYDYIYNKLNETFRNNNFGNVNKLEEFIKNTFYENTVIKNAQCKQEGNAYVFTMQITNQEGTEKLKDVTIIMQLLEDRNFVMSFAK